MEKGSSSFASGLLSSCRQSLHISAPTSYSSALALMGTTSTFTTRQARNTTRLTTKACDSREARRKNDIGLEEATTLSVQSQSRDPSVPHLQGKRKVALEAQGRQRGQAAEEDSKDVEHEKARKSSPSSSTSDEVVVDADNAVTATFLLRIERQLHGHRRRTWHGLPRARRGDDITKRYIKGSRAI